MRNKLDLRSKSPDKANAKRLRLILGRLERAYGLERHGNVRDAFWELVLIVISVRTTQSVYLPVYRTVREAYPTIERLAAARITSLRWILVPAGLSKLKAWQIRNAAKSILRDFGPTGLTRAGRRDPVRVETYLRDLPGVGAKVAKCVTMYACDATVLPVDAHVWRVMSRLGYAPGGRLTERVALDLEFLIPPSMRYAVHVLCISHGRAICKPRPACPLCPINSLCPSAGTF